MAPVETFHSAISSQAYTTYSSLLLTSKATNALAWNSRTKITWKAESGTGLNSFTQLTDLKLLLPASPNVVSQPQGTSDLGIRDSLWQRLSVLSLVHFGAGEGLAALPTLHLCSNLTKLSIGPCISFPDSDLSWLSAMARTLRHLHLLCPPNEPFYISLVGNLGQLTRLESLELIQRTPSSFPVLGSIDASAVLQKLTNLQFASLPGLAPVSMTLDWVQPTLRVLKVLPAQVGPSRANNLSHANFDQFYSHYTTKLYPKYGHLPAVRDLIFILRIVNGVPSIEYNIVDFLVNANTPESWAQARQLVDECKVSISMWAFLAVSTKSRRPDQLKYLVERTPRLNERLGTLQVTPLLMALSSGNSAEFIEVLLKAGVDVHAQDANSLDALATCIANSDPAIRSEHFELLLKYGANINTTTTRGENLLMLAIQAVDIPKAKFVAWRGVDLHHRDADGLTAFHYACCYPETYQALTEGEVFKNPAQYIDMAARGWTPLAMAAAVPADIEAILHELLRLGANPDDSYELLGCSAAALHLRINSSRKLADKMFDDVDLNRPGADGWTLTHYALASAPKDLIRLFIARGGDLWKPSSMGLTPVMVACFLRKFPESFWAELMARCPDKTAEFSRKTTDGQFGVSYLHLAVAANRLGTVFGLLEAGADPNVLDIRGNSPLAYAVTGDGKIVEELLTRGANPNVQPFGSMPPIALAAQQGDIFFLERLYQAGADPNTPIDAKLFGQSKASFNVVYPGHLINPQLLEKAWRDLGVRVDLVSGGYTAFQVACLASAPAAKESLGSLLRALDQKIRDFVLNHVDPTGHTPYSAAKANGKDALAEMLLGAGAHPATQPKLPPSPYPVFTRLNTSLRFRQPMMAKALGDLALSVDLAFTQDRQRRRYIPPVVDKASKIQLRANTQNNHWQHTFRFNDPPKSTEFITAQPPSHAPQPPNATATLTALPALGGSFAGLAAPEGGFGAFGKATASPSPAAPQPNPAALAFFKPQ